MDVTESSSDFIEFYLSSRCQLRTIDLIKKKVSSAINAHSNEKSPKKPTDLLLQKVTAFRASLHFLKKYEKQHLFRGRTFIDTPEAVRTYLKLGSLSPEDCLIALSKTRYGIEAKTLSLILNLPSESIDFREKQVKRYFNFKILNEFSPQEFQKQNLAQIQSAFRELPKGNWLSRFRNLPLTIRFLIETSSVLTVLVLLMWIIPEIRNSYESSVQKRINEFFIESSLTDSPPPAGMSHPPKILGGSTPETAVDGAIENETPPEVLTANPRGEKKQPKVYDGETWRFSFTGSQTNEIETGIVTALKKIDKDAVKPLTVPGGIQFEFLLPTQRIILLKVALEALTSTIQRKMDSQNQSALSLANLSWYKKKQVTQQRIPAGHVLTIIWISTL